MKTKKILLVGASLISGNRGVNALTRSAIEGLIDHLDSPQIKIFSYTAKKKITHTFYIKNQQLLIEEIPVNTKCATLLSFLSFIEKKVSIYTFISKIDSFKEILTHIDWADLILDISEGDSFSDIYGWKRFVMHSNIKILAVNKNKNLVLLPQTMGPFKNKMFQKIAKYICNHAKYNYARDMISFNYLRDEIGVKENKIKYCPDLAFYMKPIEKDAVLDIKQDVASDILVGINISGLLYNGGYSKNNMFGFISNYKEVMEKIVEMFLEEYKNVKIIFIPHVITNNLPVEDDLLVCRKMYHKYNERYPGRTYLWKDYLREDEIKGMLKNCDFFIGGRMHSCIGAISSGVPTSPIAYSRKFIGIWEQFGLEDFVADPRKHTIDEIISIIKKSFENRERVLDQINSTNEKFKNELRNMFLSL